MGTNPFAAEMIRMRIPEGLGDVIVVEGFTLEADADGCVSVPRRLQAGLESHGLTLHVETAKPGKK